MLLPAVQQVREASRRASCANNLRQIAVATMNFESSFSALPAGTTSISNNDVHHTWAAFILPHMEENNSHDEIDFDVASWWPWVAGQGWNYDPPANPDAPWAIRKYPVYTCPSQPEVVHTSTAGAFSHGNYVANSGFVYAVRQVTSESQMEFENPRNLRGPFEKEFSMQSKGVSLQTISDGTSSTAMYAETKLFPGNDGRGLLFLSSGTYYQHWFTPNAVGDDQNEFCDPNSQEYPCRDDGVATRVGSLTSRSFHPVGVNVVFTDGHVEFISENIDRRVWVMMGTRAQADFEETPLVDPLPPIFD